MPAQACCAASTDWTSTISGARRTTGPVEVNAVTDKSLGFGGEGTVFLVEREGFHTSFTAEEEQVVGPIRKSSEERSRDMTSRTHEKAIVKKVGEVRHSKQNRSSEDDFDVEILFSCVERSAPIEAQHGDDLESPWSTEREKRGWLVWGVGLVRGGRRSDSEDLGTPTTGGRSVGVHIQACGCRPAGRGNLNSI